MDGEFAKYLQDVHSADPVEREALTDECDVVVAVASLGHGDPASVEPAVMDFLRSKPMVLWAKRELGLEFVAREW